jgi:cytochrome c oxidase assembly factor CtaG
MELHELVHMAGMGLLTSAVAPTIARLGRHSPLLRRGSWPGWLTLPAFLLLHGAVTLEMGRGEPPPPVHLVIDSLLLAAAVLFWLPVLGEPARRLDGVGRCVYLFVAMPALDIPAVVLVAQGHAAGGLAMIVAMLPIGLLAVGLFWQLIAAEEAAVRRAEAAETDPPPRLEVGAPAVLEPPHADP